MGDRLTHVLDQRQLMLGGSSQPTPTVEDCLFPYLDCLTADFEGAKAAALPRQRRAKRVRRGAILILLFQLIKVCCEELLLHDLLKPELTFAPKEDRTKRNYNLTGLGGVELVPSLCMSVNLATTNIHVELPFHWL